MNTEKYKLIKKVITIFSTVILFVTPLSVYAQKVCVVAIDPTKMDWSSIDNCKKNDVLDVLVYSPYNPSGGVPNYVTRLIANFCDYNKSIVVDKSNKLESSNASFTCIKRN